VSAQMQLTNMSNNRLQKCGTVSRTRVNIISLTLMKEYDPSCADFHESRNCSTTLFAGFLYLVSSKSDNNFEDNCLGP